VERVFLVYVDERLREELDRLSGYGFLLAEARYPAQDHGLWRQALAHLRATHPTPRLQGVPALVEKEHLPLAAADFPAYVLADYLIPFYANAFVLGHQWNRVCRLRVSGSWARTRHRSATTSIISSRSLKYRLATASFTKGHTRSTGWSSGE
jgi:hypothetical protein